MTLRTQMQRVFQQEDINFLLTNRLPRRLLTQFIGWFSRIEQAPIRPPVDQPLAVVLGP